MNLDDLSQSKSDGDKDDSVLSGGSIHKDESISSLTPLDLFLQDLDKNTARGHRHPNGSRKPS